MRHPDDDPNPGRYAEPRRHDDAERPAILDLITRAFGDPVVAELTAALWSARAGTDGLSFVVGPTGRPVGHTLLTRSWLDAPARLVEVLVLSPLSVDPAHQRRGIGAALVRHAVDQAAGTGLPLLFLEGSPAYYGRLGFEPAAAHGFTAPSVRIPAPAFQVVRLPGYQPWMTGALVYAEQFWQYDCVGLRDPA